MMPLLSLKNMNKKEGSVIEIKEEGEAVTNDWVKSSEPEGILEKKLRIGNLQIFNAEGETKIKKLEDEGVFRADESWKSAIKTVKEANICMVIGPMNSGKSTFTRFLINKMFN
jgi:predicted kinase